MGEVELSGGARAILENLRDRSLLKYLFYEDPEVAGPYGYVDQPIDLETQHEIAETLAQKALKARTEPPAKAHYEDLIERLLKGVPEPSGDPKSRTIRAEAAEAISTLLKERDAALAGQCVHEWEWVKTAVDMSNTNFVTMRCSKCGTTRYEEHLGGVGSGGGSLPRA